MWFQHDQTLPLSVSWGGSPNYVPSYFFNERLMNTSLEFTIKDAGLNDHTLLSKLAGHTVNRNTLHVCGQLGGL